MPGTPTKVNEKDDRRLRRDIARQLEEAFADSGIAKNHAVRLTGLGMDGVYRHFDPKRQINMRALLVLTEAIGYRVDVTITKRGGK